jgi:hypothetical protein
VSCVVFESGRESPGDPAESLPPETETAVVGATKRLAAIDPTSGDDVLVLYVDAIHRPAQSGESTFTGGDENGRAWVWNPKSRTIVCAGFFSSTTPHEVLATFFLSPEDRPGEVDSNLMLALRHASIRSAFAGLTAAGPPK